MRKTVYFLFVLLILACTTSYEYPFLNPKLSVEKRAEDIVSRLTLEEKVHQMLNNAPAIDRLGIPAYNWWNECLHGIGRTDYKTTVFPQAIAMAAGWDKDAMKQMADYTATEGRAIYNTSIAKGEHLQYHGLTYWTPNINIFRDPRWGRGQETYGEDPYLTSILAANFVQGLQGDDAKYMRAAACAKHFAVHSGPEHNRHSFNTVVSEYDLWDTYLPAFKVLADNGVAGFMCAYNAYDDEPCCGSDKLMLDILRNSWNYQGYVTSDCGAIDNFYNHHKTHPDAAHAAADAVAHGTDLDCGHRAYLGLLEAVEKELITEEQIDISLKRLFALRIKLGMFDDASLVPYAQIDSSYLEKEEHKALAYKMAQQSVVMLKNDINLLPVNKNKIKTVAILGPNSDNAEAQLGNYNGFPTKIYTILDGIREKLADDVVIFHDTLTGHYGELSNLAIERIKKLTDVDLVIFAGGISPQIEGEEMPHVTVDGFCKGDRTTIALPQNQQKLLSILKSMDIPLVFVMMTGSAISFDTSSADAVLNSWYGGEFSGKAVADIIFGDYNPSGKLPVTFYANDEDLPDFEDYDMSNRTYRYFQKQALYPFGYGLSFNTYDYAWSQGLKEKYSEKDILRCSFTIKNLGEYFGDDVAQIYIRYPENKGLPLKELRDFHRISLNSQEEQEVKVRIPIKDLSKWDGNTNSMKVPKGVYTLYIGPNSSDAVIETQFEIL